MFSSIQLFHNIFNLSSLRNSQTKANNGVLNVTLTIQSAILLVINKIIVFVNIGPNVNEHVNRDNLKPHCFV